MRGYGSIVDVNYFFLVRSVFLLTYSIFCQHPPRLNEVLKYMSEAIISRRGSGGGSSGGGTLRTEIIAFNTNWVVPNHIGSISVRLFGGGSAGYGGEQGGCGGWMNNKDLSLSNGIVVPITIGIGGKMLNTSGISGGTTSFGTYLSANGGTNIAGGSGGGGSNGRYGGGTGYQFGGGGGKISVQFVNINYEGGDGGIWGGGGGGNGKGGTYGGNGCVRLGSAENGTNTMSNSSVPVNMRGYGIAGQSTYGAGGGGFGGNGGNGVYSPSGQRGMCGGGGGYGIGASGGNAGMYQYGDGGGGGGGGYNSRGGNGGMSWGGGGGGGYGDGGGGTALGVDGGIGAGGAGTGKGGNGICIVEYYQ